MSKEEILRPWGIGSNPFEVTPLESNDHDMTLFIGREPQLNRAMNILRDMSSGIHRRIVIVGQVGAGKSSFLNRVVYELHKVKKPRCLPITMEGGPYSQLGFLLILLGKLCTVLINCEELSATERDTVKSVSENLEYAIEYLRSDAASIGGVISAIFAQVKGEIASKNEKTFKVRQYTEHTAWMDVEKLTHIVNNHFDGVFIGIDEADRLVRSGLLEQARSMFFAPACSFALVGSQSLPLLIRREGSPVREIFEDFIELPLQTYPGFSGELHKAVETRLQSVRIQGLQFSNPFTEDGLVRIFEASQGVIRNVIRYCYQMLESGIDQGKVVDADLVRAEIRRSGEMIHEELSARSRDLTALIFRLGGKIYGSDKTLSKRYGKSISGLRSKLRELEVLGMVSVSLDNRGRLSYLLSPELMAFYSAKQEAQKPPRRELKEFLSPEMKILMELYRSGPLTYQEISSRLDMGKALTSRRLTVLMDQGLIDGEWHTMNPGSARRMFMRRYGLRGELSSLKNPPRFPPFQRTNPRRPRRSKRGR